MVNFNQEEKIYASALKLRGIEESIEKLATSGTLDIILECLQDIKRTEPDSKTQLKVLAGLMLDEIWSQKSQKAQKKTKTIESPMEDQIRSMTARSTQMLTSARSCEFSRISLTARRPSQELIVFYMQSEFNQSKGPTFSKAPREPTLNKTAPGPGSYNPLPINKDKTPIALFGKSARPEHFVKPVCQESYNPLHYFASRPITRRD